MIQMCKLKSNIQMQTLKCSRKSKHKSLNLHPISMIKETKFWTFLFDLKYSLQEKIPFCESGIFAILGENLLLAKFKCFSLLLLASSISFNLFFRSDSWTRTPIHWAAHSRHTEVVRELLAHGALPDPVDKNYKFTPLMLAARFVNQIVMRPKM